VRVLHVCNASGGAPWLVEILRELRDRGHEVAAVVRGDDGSLAAALREIGVRYIVLDHDMLAGANPFVAARRILRLISLFRQERPDIVQAHLFSSTIATRIAAWIADVPIRLSMNTGPYYLESPILGDVDVRTAWVDTRIIASCEYTRRLYIEKGVPADAVDLIYYGSNAARFDPAHVDRGRIRRELGVGDDVPIIGMVAYFYPPSRPHPAVSPAMVNRGIKGHDVLLKAVPLVLAKLPDARFVLVGDGWGERGKAYRLEMEALAASLGIAHSVTFLGHRLDVPDLLAGFDVALQCSLSENLGGAIEALMMQAPLIVSRTGGLVDAVRDEETGLVVPPDDPPALAAAICRLIDDRALAQRLAAAGRKLMLERFTAARTGADLDDLYRSCAAAARFAGRPPHLAGYRLGRTVLRSAWSPIWALQLLRMVWPVVLAVINHRRASGVGSNDAATGRRRDS
jgi:glycosyltransferase involved in cell wall biosynthesis